MGEVMFGFAFTANQAGVDKIPLRRACEGSLSSWNGVFKSANENYGQETAGAFCGAGSTEPALCAPGSFSVWRTGTNIHRDEEHDEGALLGAQG